MESSSVLDVVLIILGAAIVLLIAVAIPVLIQIRQAVRRLSQTLQVLNSGLPGIVSNIEEITIQLKGTTTTVNRQVEALSLVSERIRGILALLASLEAWIRRGVRSPWTSSQRTAQAFSKGLSAFLATLLTDRPAEWTNR